MKPELSKDVQRAYVSIFSVNVKPERLEQFLSALGRVLPHSAEEQGILRFEIFRSRTNPNAFTIVDLYRDEAAFQSHSKTPHLARLSEEIKGCFEGDPRFELYDVHDGIPCK